VPTLLVGGPVREHLIYEAVKSQRASWRAGTHATKTRGQVSGGGKKPWRQKGTGRARAGSTRSPIWSGGGRVRPQPRDYSTACRAERLAATLRSVLAVRHGRAGSPSSTPLPPEPRPSSCSRPCAAWGVEGTTLLVLPEQEAALLRAARNLRAVKVVAADGLTVYDVLAHRNLGVTQAALGRLVTRLEGAA
jgi:large subunit ribosomal protein L4